MRALCLARASERNKRKRAGGRTEEGRALGFAISSSVGEVAYMRASARPRGSIPPTVGQPRSGSLPIQQGIDWNLQTSRSITPNPLCFAQSVVTKVVELQEYSNFA